MAILIIHDNHPDVVILVYIH
uniref:Uncharacterized protein n=1 Tax=Lepeophtheirus salmonis TaxID=72036 RepID=A0A0K2T8B8_LEPSM